MHLLILFLEWYCKSPIPDNTFISKFLAVNKETYRLCKHYFLPLANSIPVMGGREIYLRYYSPRDKTVTIWSFPWEDRLKQPPLMYGRRGILPKWCESTAFTKIVIPVKYFIDDSLVTYMRLLHNPDARRICKENHLIKVSHLKKLKC